MDADDRGVTGARGLLAIFAATLCLEEAGADYGVANFRAEAATDVCFAVLEHVCVSLSLRMTVGVRA
jgi:hypothetical protein